MSNKSPIGSSSHFANIGNWKARSPASNPQRLLLKAESRQFFIHLQQSHISYIRQPRSQSISCSPRPNLGYHNSIFCKHDATIMQSWWSVLPLSESSSFWYSREWMLGIPKKNGGNGFLKQTCRTNLLSAVSHSFRTSATERLVSPFPTHCC